MWRGSATDPQSARLANPMRGLTRRNLGRAAYVYNRMLIAHNPPEHLTNYAIIFSFFLQLFSSVFLNRYI
jgi:hypothetical protein